MRVISGQPLARAQAPQRNIDERLRALGALTGMPNLRTSDLYRLGFQTNVEARMYGFFDGLLTRMAQINRGDRIQDVEGSLEEIWGSGLVKVETFARLVDAYQDSPASRPEIARQVFLLMIELEYNALADEKPNHAALPVIRDKIAEVEAVQPVQTASMVARSRRLVRFFRGGKLGYPSVAARW